MEESLARVEKLLALMLVHDMRDAPAGDKALALNRAGFSPAEIGELLGERSNTISVQIMRAKRAARIGARTKKS